MANNFGLFFTRDGQVIRLPVNPEQLPVEKDNANDDYNVLGIGPIMVPRTPKQRVVTISSFFPVGKRYSFMPADALEDGWQYVSFFERNRPRMLPFRIIILDDRGVCRLNSPCSVDSFSWSVKRNGDIAYSLTLREYRFISGVT